MRLLLALTCCCLFLFSCESPRSENDAPATASKPEAQAIINQSIQVHGGSKFEDLKVSFDFRNKHYQAIRQNGLFEYVRAFTDSTGAVKDVLRNDGFTRTINGNSVTLTQERSQAFTSSVNSVIYFALLPFGLNDPAVQKEWLGLVTIKGIPYHKIKVTFRQQGGGEDFQDQFLYWINQKTGTMDYLAYTYATDGGGVRFRQAIQPRTVGGLRFQDYINYEPAASVDFWQIEKQFEAGQLKELSRIEIVNLKVTTP